MNYDRPTPETDAFMTLIDDSEIDLGQVQAKLHDMEAERDHAREVLAALSHRVHSGYDFNADPDNMTLLVGDTLRPNNSDH